MRMKIDLTPLFRPVADVSQVRDVLQAASGWGGADGPTCTIEKIDSGRYRLKIDARGFRPHELVVRTRPNRVIVSGTPVLEGRGRRMRRPPQAFEHVFEVPDHVVVKSAAFRDGALEIELRRDFPAALPLGEVEILDDDAVEPWFANKRDGPARLAA